MRTAAIVPSARARTLGDLDEQIRQPDIRAVPFNQRVLWVLPTASAFLADKLDEVAGIGAEWKRAGHCKCGLSWLFLFYCKGCKVSNFPSGEA